MRKTAILDLKVGTGKTTTAVNLSHAFAVTNNRVLARNSWKKLLLEQTAILVSSTGLTGAGVWFGRI